MSNRAIELYEQIVRLSQREKTLRVALDELHRVSAAAFPHLDEDWLNERSFSPQTLNYYVIAGAIAAASDVLAQTGD